MECSCNLSSPQAGNCKPVPADESVPVHRMRAHKGKFASFPLRRETRPKTEGIYLHMIFACCFRLLSALTIPRIALRSCSRGLTSGRLSPPTFEKVGAVLEVKTAGCFKMPRSSEARECRTTDRESILDGMDKKEIESPKLTANFLLWISAFVLLLFALLAHFVWKVF